MPLVVLLMPSILFEFVISPLPQPERRYVALTVGVPYPPQGEIGGFIGKDIKTRQYTWSQDNKELTQSQSTKTRYQVLGQIDPHVALVEFLPETGRTYQLRLQASFVSYISSQLQIQSSAGIEMSYRWRSTLCKAA